MKAARPGKVARSAARPSVGLAVAYRRRMAALIREMQDSYEHWVVASYRANPPAIAQDANAAAELARQLRGLGARWQKRFNEAAPKLARWFATAVHKRSAAALRKILRDAGISVAEPSWRRTLGSKAAREALEATVTENVSLIKSIPAQYHTQVEGLVMRSVTSGRDLATLTKDLQARYPITLNRAVLIARDQNNKATSAMQTAQQLSLGIKEGEWLHSHGGKEPRPTHLANHGRRFSLREGWFDPDPKVRRRIRPGELINCRCVWKPVVEGFS